MNNLEIETFLKRNSRTRRIFKGIFSRDRLPYLDQKPVVPCVFVVNTALLSHPGEHWQVIYLDSNRAEFFDSFGLPAMHQEIVDFLLAHHTSYTYNKIPIQPIISHTCGLYCIHYIRQKSIGRHMADITVHFDPLRPYFNDQRVRALVGQVTFL